MYDCGGCPDAKSCSQHPPFLITLSLEELSISPLRYQTVCLRSTQVCMTTLLNSILQSLHLKCSLPARIHMMMIM
jgi:hypothetical protein